MVGANTYIGIVATDARDAILYDIRRTDSLRLLWIKLILPSLMKKEFIDKVVTSDDNMCSFIIDTNGPNPTLAEGDLRDLDVSRLSSHWHTAFYQNFSHLTNEHTPLGMTPWQIRFEFAKQTLSILIPVSPVLRAEIESLFKENGWKFWFTDSGFSITPMNLYNNIKAAADAFMGWMDIYNKPIREASPHFENYLETATAPSGTVTLS
jgi:hypothetical protein